MAQKVQGLPLRPGVHLFEEELVGSWPLEQLSPALARAAQARRGSWSPGRSVWTKEAVWRQSPARRTNLGVTAWRCRRERAWAHTRS
jgi:hypothetical protein